MSDNIPPEEKLLRLIRGEKRDKAKHALPAAVDKAGFAAANPAVFPGKELRNPVNPQITIRVLLLLACLFLAFSIVQPFFTRKIALPPETAKGELKENLQQPISQLKSLEFYQQEVSGKNLFGGSGAGSRPAAAAIDTDLMKDLALVGIISGDNPQAVIEDIKSQKTYYLTKGQYIGAFLVEDIQEGKIIVNHSGKRYEMAL